MTSSGAAALLPNDHADLRAVGGGARLVPTNQASVDPKWKKYVIWPPAGRAWAAPAPGGVFSRLFLPKEDREDE